MISIEGLNDRQRNIMDLLWSCQTMSDVQAFIQALPTEQDRMDARGLILIATWDSLEQELGLQAYEQTAVDCINSAR